MAGLLYSSQRHSLRQRRSDEGYCHRLIATFQDHLHQVGRSSAKPLKKRQSFSLIIPFSGQTVSQGSDKHEHGG